MKRLLPLLLSLFLLLSGCAMALPERGGTISLEAVPDFSGSPYVEIDGNIPDFAEEALLAESFENYSELDILGRCGQAFACVGTELMPEQERGSIGQVKPSGWQTVKYDCVDGKYLYNRCHLIGYQLTAENANPNNLITGTRYLNIDGMLPFENMTADYIKETGNHVLYRVTPIFKAAEFVARGVHMEALSVEDKGEGICFNVYCYNSQPGIDIDYLTGMSCLSGAEGSVGTQTEQAYVLNEKSHKFHLPSCSSAGKLDVKNRSEFEGDRQTLIDTGYSPCGVCKP